MRLRKTAPMKTLLHCPPGQVMWLNVKLDVHLLRCCKCGISFHVAIGLGHPSDSFE